MVFLIPVSGSKMTDSRNQSAFGLFRLLDGSQYTDGYFCSCFQFCFLYIRSDFYGMVHFVR